MSSSEGINEQARSGFAKGSAYDAYRPAYSATIVQALLENLGVAGRQKAVILDLAAGTGKFTEALTARDEEFEIIAVEPHDRMRQVLADKNLPRVTVKDGRGESIPLDDESVDAVICAQAFHWFANKEALRELYRVLREGSSLGMVWNVDDNNAPRGHQAVTTWEAKTHKLIWSFEDSEPRYRSERWRQVFEDQVQTSPLSLITAGDAQLFTLPLGEHREKYEVRLSKDKIWDRFNTLSQIAVLEGEDRERTYKIFMDALNSPDVVVDENGDIGLHGETVAVWTSKIPEEL